MTDTPTQREKFEEAMREHGEQPIDPKREAEILREMFKPKKRNDDPAGT